MDPINKESSIDLNAKTEIAATVVLRTQDRKNCSREECKLLFLLVGQIITELEKEYSKEMAIEIAVDLLSTRMDQLRGTKEDLINERSK